MKEILDRALSYGPEFLNRLVRLLTSPKSFLVETSAPQQESLNQAMVFFLCCVLLAFVLELPFAAAEDATMLAAVTSMIAHVCFILVASVVYLLGFRLVGGRTNFLSFFIVTLYISGVYSVMFALVAPVSKGYVLAKDPSLYPEFKSLMDRYATFDITSFDEVSMFIGKTDMLVGGLLALLVFSSGIVWQFATWGAYRRIAQVGRLRSGTAMLISLLIGTPIGYFLTLAQRALKINLF